jgi:hypothetical protein
MALSALGLVLAPSVHASKPVREPVALEPLELAAGEGCSFDVRPTSRVAAPWC